MSPVSPRNMAAILVFLVFYIGLGAYLTLSQERIIYLPAVQDFEACAAFQDAQKINHNGTRMYVEEGERGMVVLYHGNAGSACDRDFYARTFRRSGFGYAIVEYAGYSNDPRQTTHELVKQDVRNVIDYLTAQKVANVLVVGESIGTGLASYHASLAPPQKLLLISPFTSLADVAQRIYWFYPAKWLVDNAFDNIELLSAYDGDLTIMQGEDDSIIPPALGRKLYENLATPRKRLITIEGVGHNDLFASPKAHDTLREFVAAGKSESTR